MRKLPLSCCGWPTTSILTSLPGNYEDMKVDGHGPSHNPGKTLGPGKALGAYVVNRACFSFDLFVASFAFIQTLGTLGTCATCATRACFLFDLFAVGRMMRLADHAGTVRASVIFVMSFASVRQRESLPGYSRRCPFRKAELAGRGIARYPLLCDV